MPENSLPVSSSEATEFVRSFDQIKNAARRFGNELENLTDAVAKSQAVQIAANIAPGRRGPQPRLETSFQQASAQSAISEREWKEFAEKVAEEIILRVENSIRAAPVAGEAIGVFDAIFGDIPQLQIPGEPAGFKLLGGAFEKLKERSRDANLRQQAAIANKLEDLITDLVLRQQTDVAPLAKVLEEEIARNSGILERSKANRKKLLDISKPDSTVLAGIENLDRIIANRQGRIDKARQDVENKEAQFDVLIAKAQSVLNRLNRETAGGRILNRGARTLSLALPATTGSPALRRRTGWRLR